jgi:hypothetical protein
MIEFYPIDEVRFRDPNFKKSVCMPLRRSQDVTQKLYFVKSFNLANHI